jgi:NAD(P)H-dependent FMN reductase
MTTILALSGSLRSASSNGALLTAVARLAPAGVRIERFDGIATLPHFNPELDEEGMTPPPAVKEWRERLAKADGVVISMPEYAHGVPGAFKNALDWIVSSGEFTDKPTLLLNAAPHGGERAQAAIAGTLEIMGARLLRDASRLSPFLRARLAPDAALEDPEAVALLRESLAALIEATRHAV